MSQQPKRKYVRRKKAVALPDEITQIPFIEPTAITKQQTQSYSNITSLQDEEYEMSIMMDIIKMQEREEIERNEKEKEKQIRDAEELEEKIKIRDHNIKEMLRKIKVGNLISQIESTIIYFLENVMETQDMQIIVNDKLLYHDICCYLGIGDENKRGTIRLHETVKLYAKNLFTHLQI